MAQVILVPGTILSGYAFLYEWHASDAMRYRSGIGKHPCRAAGSERQLIDRSNRQSTRIRKLTW
jgi:hypothetical protein